MARKVIGYIFIIAAILGLIFSLAGIGLVWVVKAPLTANLISTLDLIDTTLDATSSGLTVIDDTLSKTISDLSSIENTVQTAGKGIDDSVPLVESLSTLLSDNIPQAISATQTGLTTLQDAAGTFESTLQLVTSIPFLPIEGYDPDVSFSDALEDVSQSLDAIPQSLSEMEGTLSSTEGNLVMMGAQINIIARNISELKDSFYEIQLVFDQYQEVISEAQTKLGSFRDSLQTGIIVTAWIFTIIFVWLGIAQLGLLTQGLERVDLRSANSTQIMEDSSGEEILDEEEIVTEAEHETSD
jgi:methyl-accepting chemotaxis protein